MEFVSGLFVGYLLNWWAIIGFCLLCTISIRTESPIFATLFLAVLGLIVYNMFTLTAQELLYYGIGYFVFGFVWSFWRYKKFVREEITKFNERSDINHHMYSQARNKFITTLDTSKNIDKILFWIVLCPFSVLESLVGDVFDFVERLITVYFKSIYTRILSNELKNLKTDIQVD